MSRTQRDGGQSTVEFALVLPIAVLVLATALFALLDIRDRILIVHAARAAARVAASSDDISAVETAGRSAAPQISPEALSFEVIGERKAGSLVGVVVRYHRPRLPAIGSMIGIDSEISARLLLPAEVAE